MPIIQALPASEAVLKAIASFKFVVPEALPSIGRP